jgi:hypothetical protein
VVVKEGSWSSQNKTGSVSGPQDAERHESDDAEGHSPYLKRRIQSWEARMKLKFSSARLGYRIWGKTIPAPPMS